ncbi:hypothetical protein [Caudoviricetes sp.]|nr:hypothetical protein [Caudoviricetes sp.]
MSSNPSWLQFTQQPADPHNPDHQRAAKLIIYAILEGRGEQYTREQISWALIVTRDLPIAE